MARVVLDDGAEGLAAMLAALLSAAAEDPAKVRVLDAASGTVTVAVPDAGVEAGLRFLRGTCRVSASAVPGADVRIEMPSETLLSFSSIPLRHGLPSPRAPEGRAFLRALLRREVRVGGLRHLGLLRQVTTLLSVA